MTHKLQFWQSNDAQFWHFCARRGGRGGGACPNPAWHRSTNFSRANFSTSFLLQQISGPRVRVDTTRFRLLRKLRQNSDFQTLWQLAQFLSKQDSIANYVVLHFAIHMAAPLSLCSKLRRLGLPYRIVDDLDSKLSEFDRWFQSNSKSDSD